MTQRITLFNSTFVRLDIADGVLLISKICVKNAVDNGGLTVFIFVFEGCLYELFSLVLSFDWG